MKKLLPLLVSPSLESANKEKQQIKPPARYLVMLAALIGCDSIDTYKQMFPKAVEE